MSHHFLSETLPLIVFGLAGIMVMILVKINDINHRPETDNLNYGDVLKIFFKKEWASYAVSILLVLITAYTHDEWIIWFTSGKLSSVVGDVPIGVKLAMVLWGMIGHYLLYKYVLGKLEKSNADKS